MPAFQINDAEWAALVEEPGDVFLLYCSIRRFMDYATGIAGIKRRISEQMLREVLYVTPTRGRHDSGSPTRQRVRSVLDRLLTLGVLEPRGPMVYLLPLASRDGLPETSATEQQPHQQPYQQPNENQPEPSNGEACGGTSGLSATESETADPLNSNLPPVSGKSKEHTHSVRDKFAMSDAWEPDPSTFSAVLFRNGMANQTFSAHQLLEFRSFWIANPDQHRTQAQWEHALAQQLKRQSRNYQAKGNPHETSGRPTRSRARNAHDILTDTRW